MKLCWFLFFLAAASAVAQQTESERMSQILSPTLNPVTSLQNKSFYGGADKGFAAKSGRVKSFYWSNLFKPKSFSGTKSYGASSYWTGEYEGGKKKGPLTGKYAIRDLDKKAEVKTSEVKDARESRKTTDTRDYAGNRPYLVQGKSQKILDSQQEQSKPLTVDEVRELLNTTR